MRRPWMAPSALLLLVLASSRAGADVSSLVGKTVWNRSIYRLEAADGSSFRIKALATMTLVRVEGSGSDEVPWFAVEGKGEARPSRHDVARIGALRAAGKLPADWSWVHASDPKAAHPDWDETFWKAIEDRTITHGMTPEMVRMAFGEPDKINVNKRPENVQEHWQYDTGAIWFVEGKVFSWQAP